ncbi:MAG: hypothetical protein KatS3mg111_3309 [Pirellulaceae bacterium]|nr:MAG: hypothetical protein KatS3mg111_3309 [Pirellulaceae bacterium]
MLARYRWFLLWLACVYAGWLFLVLYHHAWSEIAQRWGISIAMLFGSFVAGSTPMGGGTIGFPVLVVLFDGPASLGRDFGLAIQSVGMVSASIFILSRRQPLAWNVLWPAMVGSAVGLLVGLTYIAPAVDDLVVKLTFAVIWASFGLMTLYRLGELQSMHAVADPATPLRLAMAATIGLLGGVVSSITGVGIDMLIYALLVMYDRCDLRIAIPTSVLLMAGTSLMGVMLRSGLAAVGWLPEGFSSELFYYWLAAAPVVALGAPCGALVVSRIGRVPVLVFVALLCVWQYVWIAWDSQLALAPLAISLAAIGLLFGVFNWLHGLKGGTMETPLLPANIATESPPD